eukprot:gene910-1766_t
MSIIIKTPSTGEISNQSIVSEFSGWLLKRGHGPIKSWKRRFFLLNISTSKLTYYIKEPLPEQRHVYKGSLQITNFTELDDPEHRPPHDLNNSLGLVINTTHPLKSTVFLFAENEHEKSLWVTYLQRSLNFNYTVPRYNTTWKSMHRIVMNMDEDDNNDDDNESDDTLRMIDIMNMNFEHKTVVLIASFILDIGTIARMSVVNKTWYRSYSRATNKPMWQWLVKHGAVASNDRWVFWCTCMGTLKIPTATEYEELIRGISETVTADILRDVNRSFGYNPSKRSVPRRSILLNPLGENNSPDKQSQSHQIKSSDAQNRNHNKYSHNNNSNNQSITDDTNQSYPYNRPAERVSIEPILEDCEEYSSETGSEESPSRPAANIHQWVYKQVNSFRKISLEVPDMLKRSPSKHSSWSPNRGNIHDNNVGTVMLHRESTPNLLQTNTSLTSTATSSSTSKEMSEEDKKRKKYYLTRILHALAARFEEVGYCQGLDRIVLHAMRAARCAVSSDALISCGCGIKGRDIFNKQKEREVFAFVTALFENMALSEMYSRHGVVGLRIRVAILARLIERHCPELFHHISSLGLPIDAFGISWIQTLFLYIEAMPALTIDKIWDVFLLESKWNIIYSVAIAILKLSEQDLLTKDVDDIVFYFNNFPDPKVLDDNILLQKAFSIDISSDYLMELDEEFRKVIK